MIAVHFLRNVLLGLIAAALVIFAIANREPIGLNVWPLPYRVELPIFGALLGALAVGLVLGGTGFWLGQLRWRRRAHVAEKKAARLEDELAAARLAPAREPTPNLPALAPSAASAPPRRARAALLDDD